LYEDTVLRPEAVAAFCLPDGRCEWALAVLAQLVVGQEYSDLVFEARPVLLADDPRAVADGTDVLVKRNDALVRLALLVGRGTCFRPLAQ